MKLKPQWTFGGNITMSLSEAIEHTMARSDYGAGQIEAVTAKTDVVVRNFAILIELLFESGKITKEQALSFVVGYEEVE